MTPATSSSGVSAPFPFAATIDMTSDPSALADGLAAVSLDANAPIARVVPSRHSTVDDTAPTLNLHAPAEDLQSLVQAALDQVQERLGEPDSQQPPKKTRIRPTILLNAFDLAEPREGRSGLRAADVCKIGDLSGVTRLGARFEKLPPGSRTSCTSLMILRVSRGY